MYGYVTCIPFPLLFVKHVKFKQPRAGFDLSSPNSFSSMITVTPQQRGI